MTVSPQKLFRLPTTSRCLIDVLTTLLLAGSISGCGGGGSEESTPTELSETNAAESSESGVESPKPTVARKPQSAEEMAAEIVDEVNRAGEAVRKEFGIEIRPEGSGRFTVAGIDGVAQLVEQDQDARLWRIAISPDGKTLAGAGNGLYLVLWDWETQQQTLLQRDVPNQYFSAVRFSTDGRYVIAAGDRTEVWDVAEQRLVGVFEADGWFSREESFQAFDLLPDNGLAVVIDSGRIGLWNVPEQRLLNSAEGYDYVFDISVGQEGPIAVQVGDEAVLLDRSTLEEKKRIKIGAGTLDGIGDLEISPDGKTIASSEGEAVTLWNAETGSRLHLLGTTTDDVGDLCFSPGGRYLAAAGEDSVITIWDALSGQRLVEHDTKSEWGLEIEQMVFIGESHLATVTWNNTQVWPLNQLLERSAVPDKPNVLYILEDISNIRSQVIGFGPEGNWFVGGADKDSLTEVRDRVTGESIVTLESSRDLQHADVSPNGKWVALAAWKMESSKYPGRAGVWNRSTGERVWTVPADQTVHDIVCLDDGSAVFGTPDGAVRVMGSGRSDVLVKDSFAIDIERAGSEILIAETSGRVSAWKPGKKTTLRTVVTVPGEIQNISLAADRQSVCVAYRIEYSKKFSVFDIASGKQLAHLDGDEFAQIDTVIPLSNTGPLLCVPGVLSDEPTTLRDATTGKIQAEVRNGLNRAPRPLAFSPDGKTLVARNVINRALYRTSDLLNVKNSQVLSGLLALNSELRRTDNILRVEMSGTAVNSDLSLLAGLHEQFQLTLPEDHQITAEGFGKLAEAPQIIHLDLSDNENLEPAEVAALANVSSLEELELPFLIENELLEPLGSIASLKRLDIKIAATPDTKLASLSGLTRLRQLKVSLLPDEQPVPLDWLAGMSRLQKLSLNLTSTDDQATHLAGLTSLTHLTLPDGLSGESLKHLANMKKLREIRFPNKLKVSKESLQQLGMAPIESLWLLQDMVNDEAMSALRNWRHLRDLSVSAPVTDAGLAHIAGLTKLESLDLRNSKVTDDGFQHLSALKNLRELTPPRVSFTGKGLSHLKNLLALRELDLRKTKATADGLTMLKLLPHIESLWLPSHITDDQLVIIAEVKALRSLNLANTEITDDGLAVLSSLPHLKQLNIERTVISDSGLKHLRKIPTLDYINAAYSDITQEGVKAMNELLIKEHGRSIYVLR